MINSFDTDVAMDVGINAAILYKNIQYWCEKNKTNGMNEHEGYFWTYNSIKAFCIQFPYMSEKQIRTALNVLEEKKYIISGNFNKSAYDRTKWYADARAKMLDSNCLTGQMENEKKANENAPEGEPIPDINTYINSNNNIIICDNKKNKRFVPPKFEEVFAYCQERHNGIDAQRFIDYYSANGWKVGRNSMKDWKAAVRTWEKNNKGGTGNKSKMDEALRIALERAGGNV